MSQQDDETSCGHYHLSVLLYCAAVKREIGY